MDSNQEVDLNHREDINQRYKQADSEKVDGKLLFCWLFPHEN